MVREAAANGASLICLPEAFNTGYLGSDIPAMKKMAEPLEGESVTVMRKLAGGAVGLSGCPDYLCGSKR